MVALATRWDDYLHQNAVHVHAKIFFPFNDGEYYWGTITRIDTNTRPTHPFTVKYECDGEIMLHTLQQVMQGREDADKVSTYLWRTVALHRCPAPWPLHRDPHSGPAP